MSPVALVLADASSLRVGGLTLVERAAVLSHRMALDPVYLCGDWELDRGTSARLRSRGVSAVQRPPGSTPLGFAGSHQGVVIIGPGVLFEPAVLGDLLVQAGQHADNALATYGESATPLLLYVPPGAVAHLAQCRSIESMMRSLAAQGPVQTVPLADGFLRRVDSAASARSAERDYIRHLNGCESFFTRKIRRFSVPLSMRLVRLGAKPTQVTLGGLLLALASAWSIARGSYVAGVVGGILYYASMVFDCSDGEVARLTLQDSAFGAWFETMVDYVTYFLILAALAVVSQSRADAGALRVAAAIALVGSVVIAAVAGYLRHRVAAADPGQFDDASARAMASAGRLHRFARWGRQWIKRSSVAHLVAFLALIGQLPVLLYLWAFGATVASVIILAVEPFVVRRVAVAPVGTRNGGGGS